MRLIGYAADILEELEDEDAAELASRLKIDALASMPALGALIGQVGQKGL